MNKSIVISPDHGRTSICVSPTSNAFAGRQEPFEQERDENKIQYMDEVSLCSFLQSSNDALCRNISRKFQNLHTILIGMKNKIGGFKIIQNRLGTQVSTLVLQADMSDFSSISSRWRKESPTNICDALISYFSQNISNLHHINSIIGLDTAPGKYRSQQLWQSQQFQSVHY